MARFTYNDLCHALEEAADFLDLQEWPGDDNGAQNAANREGAARIRKMAARYSRLNEAVPPSRQIAGDKT